MARSAATALLRVRAEAAGCRNCPLWKVGTQTVFGAGPASSKIMLIGEQPGDKEDLAGEPFVGPAGRLLRQALGEVGVDPAAVYLTNAVKHFKHELKGKRRLHKTPAQREIEACRPWLVQEVSLVRPKLIVTLGATALRALFRRPVPVLANRGNILQLEADELDAGIAAQRVLVTVHPSSLLRTPAQDRERAYREFIRDLAHASG